MGMPEALTRGRLVHPNGCPHLRVGRHKADLIFKSILYYPLLYLILYCLYYIEHDEPKGYQIDTSTVKYFLSYFYSQDLQAMEEIRWKKGPRQRPR